MTDAGFADAPGVDVTGWVCPFAEGFDVPFNTLQTGLVRGGIAVNSVPASCEFTFEFRNLPCSPDEAIMAEILDYAGRELVPAMRAATGAGNAVVERLAAAPAFEADEAAAFTRFMRDLTGDRALRKVAYGTEAGLYARAGIPTLVYSPGNIEQAHSADAAWPSWPAANGCLARLWTPSQISALAPRATHRP